MLDISDIIEFFKRNENYQRGESPWLSYNPREFDRHRLVWSGLFPKRFPRREYGNYEWDRFNESDFPELDERFMRDLEETLTQGPPTDEEIKEMAQDNRWDVCAWYQPIHYYGNDWGIFIRQDCILAHALRIARFIPIPATLSIGLAIVLIRASTYAFFLHEQYHHKVESLAIRLEVVRQLSIYTDYVSKVYIPAVGTDDQLEESMANASMYRRLTTQPYKNWITNSIVEATKAYLRATFPHEPKGYRMATRYFSAGSFEYGENYLHSRVHEVTLKPSQLLSISEMGHFLNRTLWHDQAVLTSSLRPRL